ncbi:MAG: ATP-dependent helicase HrpB [gamma proteobacterium symbiont of Bathyaustriella thionipta]|nr:ATP-dependent helicase HrpB [gamma proteobacterium symbiont of Bathyaustriella thionipta]
MQNLPVTQVLPEIKTRLSQSNRLILQAPPGAGKTTLVPLALLQEPWLDNKQIIILEPRRLATRNAAARMAHILGEKVGETVGYQIRQDKRISKKTRILVLTEGILTRKLQADPELEGVGLVIFDEFHERNINADLSLAFCLQSQELLTETLKILIMSATLNTKALANLLNSPGHNAPVITSQGKSFSVDIIYQADNSPPVDRWNLTAIISQKTMTALAHYEGNILIFLPGVKEIKQLEKELLSVTKSSGQNIIVSPLYGDLCKHQQDQAIGTPPAGQRKVVLATNIAETSLTIEGINIVIDSGLQRESYFNPGSGMNALHTIMIAQDSAQQRSGRAGRLSAGVCYRLWSESRHRQLHKHQKAEILRSDLAPIILVLAQWGIQEVDELQWLDLPSPGAAAQARELLSSLQAIDSSGRITAHGKKMLSLGMHPHLAHMLLKAHTINLAETGCLIVALLTEKDILKDTFVTIQHKFKKN